MKPRNSQRKSLNPDRRKVDQLHHSSIVVDAHSDYALRVLRERWGNKTRVIENQHLPTLRSGGLRVEVLTVGGDFVIDGIDFRDPHTVFRVLDCIHCELQESPESLELVTDGKQLDGVKQRRKLFLLLTLEGASPIADDFALLRNYYRLGLRSIILTHNERNLVADGCGESPAAGLSKRGKELIKEIGKLKMIIDLVHIAEPGFFEALELVESTPVVSHSNVRRLCEHFRNLSDDQIKAVAERGGVIGLNLVCFMIHNDIQKATLDRFLDHVDYIANLVGVEHVGLGPDFGDYHMKALEEWLVREGWPTELAKYVDGVEDVSKLPKITEGLIARGYSDEEIRLVLGENFIRAYREVL